MSCPFLVAALWLAWAVYWAVAGARVKPTQWQEPIQSQVLHQGPLVLAAALLATPHFWPAELTARFLARSAPGCAAGVALVVLGLGFAVWARVHLGANWSSAVTLKDRHTLIRSGPYRHVRHPIYTGLLLAVAGTAVVIGEWRGLAALLIAFCALIYKSRLEERRLQQAFPEYADYRRTTAAIIPFIF